MSTKSYVGKLAAYKVSAFVLQAPRYKRVTKCYRGFRTPPRVRKGNFLDRLKVKLQLASPKHLSRIISLATSRRDLVSYKRKSIQTEHSNFICICCIASRKRQFQWKMLKWDWFLTKRVQVIKKVSFYGFWLPEYSNKKFGQIGLKIKQELKFG